MSLVVIPEHVERCGVLEVALRGRPTGDPFADDVWFSLANEWDYMQTKSPADWERYATLVGEEDAASHRAPPRHVSRPNQSPTHAHVVASSVAHMECMLSGHHDDSSSVASPHQPLRPIDQTCAIHIVRSANDAKIRMHSAVGGVRFSCGRPSTVPPVYSRAAWLLACSLH